jgi:hypothetical protein
MDTITNGDCLVEILRDCWEDRYKKEHPSLKLGRFNYVVEDGKLDRIYSFLSDIGAYLLWDKQRIEVDIIPDVKDYIEYEEKYMHHALDVVNSYMQDEINQNEENTQIS